MSIKVKFWGGVQTVTGSNHLIRTDHSQILLDGGLFQGRRKDFYDINTKFPAPLSEINSLILSHAHIDHSGNIPTLIKKGLKGPIHTTTATAELCRFMLPDSGHIQEEDIKFVNKLNRRKKRPLRQPLYTKEEAIRSLDSFRGHHYHQPIKITDDITATLYDAGHVLGSAVTVLDIQNRDRKIRLAYAVDLGRKKLPLLKDPEIPTKIDYLIIESTYGNREHEEITNAKGKLGEVINRTARRGGKVIIPSFAFERTQEIAYFINELQQEKKIPSMPIYVDSPLATNITSVFRHSLDYLDETTRQKIENDQDPFGYNRINYLRSSQESKKLNNDHRPMIIISASGMCEGGRILHHLRNNIENKNNTVMIVGYMAQNTLGKRIVERQPVVKIFGQEHKLKAEVVKMNAFSAHADKNELMAYVKQCGRTVKRVFLVHGDENQSDPLFRELIARGHKAHQPKKGEEITLG